MKITAYRPQCRLSARFRSFILSQTIVLLTATALFAQTERYKEYRPALTKQVLFEIYTDFSYFELRLPDSGGQVVRRYPTKSIRIADGIVSVDRVALFDKEGIHIGEILVPYERITGSYIRATDDHLLITFYTRDDYADKGRSMRRGNLLAPEQAVTVADSQFVRGMVFSVTGNITVDGEVNRDVIALFGDITVGPTATVRGDIATLTGRIRASHDADVYGELYSRKDRGRRLRFGRRGREFGVSAMFRYNRVDGATPFLTGEFTDADSVLPTVSAQVGYAFSSERLRYAIRMEQTLLRERTLTIGGAFYKRLSSGDDWLIGDNENLAFTLFFTEDYKDYYESEGGTAYLQFRPIEHLKIETRYRNEETRWFDAHPRLWSLFGGDKEFRANFSSVDLPFREQGRLVLDTATTVTFSLAFDYDTRDFDQLFERPSWAVSGAFEWSSPDFSSDFDYRRYWVRIRRYQPVNRYAMILARFAYGGSDDFLPMHKRFFLGGLGTLWGYRFKELMGTEFWMGNVEYRFRLPRRAVALGVFWDGAQVANTTGSSEFSDVKQDLGFAAYLGGDVRLSLAKRLDRSYDDAFRFYVRFRHQF